MKFSSFVASLRRICAFLLLLALLCVSFCGCGVIIFNDPEGTTEAGEATTARPDSTSPAPDTDEAIETEAPDTTVIREPVAFPSDRKEAAQARLDALSTAIDISNFDLIIASSSDSVNVIFSDEDSPVYDARMERNDMLYEKFSVDIRTIYSEEVNTETIYNDLSRGVASGLNDYYLDLLFIPAKSAGRFLAKGLLADMRTLPFYNIKEGNDAGNIASARYFDLGAGSDAPEYIQALYFNRKTLGAENSNALFAAALDGSLGWEDILTAAKSVEGSEFNIAASAGAASLAELASPLLGIEFVDNLASAPKLALTEDQISWIDYFVTSVSRFSAYAPAADGMTASEKFNTGSVPFYLGTLEDIESLYDDPIEWGLLPLPSEQKLGAVSADRPVVCLAVTNSHLEQTSIWLTGFNAASGEWMRDLYRDTLIADLMRDNNSCLVLAEMLSRRSELSFERLYDGHYEGLAGATYAACAEAVKGTAKFSEIYSKQLSAVNKKLAKLP